MPNYNKTIIVGHLTRDPDLKYTKEGTAVCEFGIAVNDYKDYASFFDVVCWKRTAEVANEYLRKGSPALIEGELRQDRWEHNGQNRSKVKIICQKLQMLGSRETDSEYSESERQEYRKKMERRRPKHKSIETPEDVPFSWVGFALWVSAASSVFV